MSVILRPATEEDMEVYISIAKRVESSINMATTDPREVREEFQRLKIFMIIYDGASVGYISYEQTEVRHAYISEVAVDPDFQRRGIGDQALKILLNGLRHNGFDVFSLHTHPDNPAKRLYERNGFIVAGRTENYFGRGTPRLTLRCENLP